MALRHKAGARLVCCSSPVTMTTTLASGSKQTLLRSICARMHTGHEASGAARQSIRGICGSALAHMCHSCLLAVQDTCGSQHATGTCAGGGAWLVAASRRRMRPAPGCRSHPSHSSQRKRSRSTCRMSPARGAVELAHADQGEPSQVRAGTTAAVAAAPGSQGSGR